MKIVTKFLSNHLKRSFWAVFTLFLCLPGKVFAQYDTRGEKIVFSSGMYGNLLDIMVEGLDVWLDKNGNGIYDSGEELIGDYSFEKVEVLNKNKISLYARSFKKLKLSPRIANSIPCDLTDINITGAPLLEELYIDDNLIKDLDLSKSSHLKILSCEANTIRNINFSGASLLENLRAADNTSLSGILDLTPCTSIKYIDLDYCDLSDIKLEGLKNVKWLSLGKNNFQTINLPVSLSNSLERLDVSSAINSNTKKGISKLDVRHLKALKEVYCSRSAVEELLVDGLQELEILDCSRNKLTQLNIASASKLKQLDIYQNNISLEEMQNLVGMLNSFIGEKNLVVINTRASKQQGQALFPEFNVCSKQLVADANSKHWAVYDVNGDFDNPTYYDGSTVEPANAQEWFTLTFSSDVAMANQVYIKGKNLFADYNGNRKKDDGEAISDEGAGNYSLHNGELTVMGSSITSVSVTQQKLISADFSCAGSLEKLDLNRNNLFSVNLSGCRLLHTLDLSHNKITSLLIPKMGELTTANFSNNQLNRFDWDEQMPLVQELDLSYNNISSIEIAQLSRLSVLAIQGNKINLQLMGKVVAQLNDMEKNPFKRLIVIDTRPEITPKNAVSTKMKKEATRKFWKMIDAATGQEYTTTDENIPSSSDEFISFVSMKEEGDPLSFYIEGEEVWIDLNNNGLCEVTESLDAKGLLEKVTLKSRNFAFYGKKIKTLQMRDQHQLTEVDASKAGSLKSLDLAGNNISKIIFPLESELTDIDLSENDFVGKLDCSGHPKLESLYFYENRINDINVENCPHLKLLSIADCELSNISLYGNMELERLYLGNNQLQQIDLSSNVNLKLLNLSNNFFNKIDLSKNKKLKELWILKNDLISLDCGMADSLSRVFVAGNKMDYEATDKLVTSLNDTDFDVLQMGLLEGKTYFKDFVIVYDPTLNISQENKISQENINRAKQKGWRVCFMQKDNLLKDYVGTANQSIDKNSRVKVFKESGKIIIRNQESSSKKVIIYDMNGRKVYAGVLEGELSISLEKGIYVLQVENNSEKLYIQ